MRLLEFLVAERITAAKPTPEDNKEPRTAADPRKAAQAAQAKVEELDVLDAA